MSTSSYRVTEKKCATCRWWQGARGIEMRANQPYYVKVEVAPAPCMALGNQPKTPCHGVPSVVQVGAAVAPCQAS